MAASITVRENEKMKKIMILLVAILLAGFVSGCSGKAEKNDPRPVIEVTVTGAKSYVTPIEGWDDGGHTTTIDFVMPMHPQDEESAAYSRCVSGHDLMLVGTRPWMVDKARELAKMTRDNCRMTGEKTMRFNRDGWFFVSSVVMK